MTNLALEKEPSHPLKTSPLHMSYHIKFSSSVGRNRREPPKLGVVGYRPVAVEVWLTPRNTCVILLILVERYERY